VALKHKKIACWILVEFKLYLIKEFQRLKEQILQIPMKCVVILCVA